MSFPSTISHPLLGTVLAALMLLGLATPTTASPVVGDAETSTPDAATLSEGIGIRLLDVPVATQNDPRAQSYIVDHVNPGETIERRVEISNDSPRAQIVHVYATAARVINGAFLPFDESANELSTWIAPAKDELKLAPGQDSEVMVTIDVPTDAAEGEQYAAVWAEARSTDAQNSQEGQVSLANRAGVRVYLSVGPGNGPAADFRINDLTATRGENNTPIVTAEVTNIGGRAVDVTGELALAKGPGGINAGPFTVDGATTIAPGATGQVAINLDPQLPTGPWAATLKLNSGLLTRDATAELTFPATGGTTTVDPDQPIPAWWWLVAAGALALLILTGVLWRHRTTAASATLTGRVLRP